MTEEQVQVAEHLVNLRIKSAMAVSSIIAFWVILFYLMFYKIETGRLYVLAPLETILGGTKLYIIAHYFPVFKAVAKSNNKPRLPKPAAKGIKP